MKIDLTRWPLLLGAALAIGLGAWLLADTGATGDRQFAAFSLLLLGSVLLGAWVRDTRGGSDGPEA